MSALDSKAIEITNLDWTFEGADTKYCTHGFHPYPARMIPQIARRLIKYYSHPFDVVLDPFCGSGTVLVESRLLGRSSVGIDLNPLAIILSRAKSTPLNPDYLKAFWLSFKKKMEKEIVSLRFGLIDVKPPSIRNLEYWFKPQVIKELTIIRNLLASIKDLTLYNFFATCFSLTVRSVSNLRPSEFKLYRLPPTKLKNYNPNVLLVFSEIVERNIRGMSEFYERAHKDVSTKVLLGDARNLPLADDSVDLIVTSPPYGDSKTTVAYGQFSRYSALWLGIDEKKVLNIDKMSLGGRPAKVCDVPSKTLKKTLIEIEKRSKRSATDVLWYFTDFYLCLKELYRVLKKDSGYCCFVVGNRTVSRVRIPTDEIYIELAKGIGFKHEITIYRRIPSKRIPWENAPENIPGKKSQTISRESIIILKT